jgi:hypothetical protein
MNIDLMVGMFLILAVISLAVWRMALSKQEDDSVHLVHGMSAVPRQATVVHRLKVIEKWGKLLTVVTVIYVIIIGSMYLYRYWVHASSAYIR